MRVFFFFHLHCISRITKGRYRDAPSIIIHNSAPVFSSLDAGKRRNPSLSFLLALVHNSPIIHPAFKEGTDLQGLKAKRQSTSRPDPEWERSGAARSCSSGEQRERDAPAGEIGSETRAEALAGRQFLSSNLWLGWSCRAGAASPLIKVEMKPEGGRSKRAEPRSGESAAPCPRRALHWRKSSTVAPIRA